MLLKYIFFCVNSKYIYLSGIPESLNNVNFVNETPENVANYY